MSSIIGRTSTDFVFEGELTITSRGAAQVMLRGQYMEDCSYTDNGVMLAIFPGGGSIYWHVLESGRGEAQDNRPLNIHVSEDEPLRIKVEV